MMSLLLLVVVLLLIAVATECFVHYTKISSNRLQLISNMAKITPNQGESMDQYRRVRASFG